jgi:hypothetical protein
VSRPIRIAVDHVDLFFLRDALAREMSLVKVAGFLRRPRTEVGEIQTVGRADEVLVSRSIAPRPY